MLPAQTSRCSRNSSRSLVAASGQVWSQRLWSDRGCPPSPIGMRWSSSQSVGVPGRPWASRRLVASVTFRVYLTGDLGPLVILTVGGCQEGEGDQRREHRENSPGACDHLADAVVLTLSAV